MNNFLQNLPPKLKVFIILVFSALSLTGLVSIFNSSANIISINPNPSVTDPSISMTSENTDEFQNDNKKDIKVQFIILSKSTNYPLEKAEIKFIFEGAPASRFTNSDGYTSIEIPNRNSIEILVKKEGYKDLIREINLNVDKRKTVTYLLEEDEEKKSYDLKRKYKEGSLIKTNSTKNLSGVINNDSYNNLFNFAIKLNENESSTYKILDNKSSRYTQYDINDSSIYTADITALIKDRKYLYKYEIPEKGIFNEKQILHEFKNNKWHQTLINEKPNKEQQRELKEISGLFANDLIPNKLIKIGESWDITPVCNQFLLSDFNTSVISVLNNSKCTAKMKEITKYNGEKSALILINGKINYKNLKVSQSIETSTKSGYGKISEFFLNDYLKDFLTHIVTDNFYNDEGFNNLKKNFEPLRRRFDSKNKYQYFLSNLLLVYEELYSNKSIESETWKNIRAEVINQLEKYQLYQYLESTNNKEKDINNYESDLFTVEFSGKTYRSLESLVDLYSEFNLNISNEETKLTGEYKSYEDLIL